MIRYVGTWVRFCALIGMSLALISCARTSTQSGAFDQSGLPSSSGNYSLVTSEYPAVVMVVLPEGSGICTGTFIGPKVVLTASHCTKKAGRYQVVSSFGTFSTYTVSNYGPGVVDDPSDISVLIFSEAVAGPGQYVSLADSIQSGETVRLVGFGCNNLDTKRGSGTKRTGTNVVAFLDEYVNFLTPASSNRGILGPDNRAGSCFGDSGGPGLKLVGSEYKLVSVTHAGGYYDSSTIISQYVNVASHSGNRNFLSEVEATYGVDISGI